MGVPIWIITNTFTPLSYVKKKWNLPEARGFDLEHYNEKDDPITYLDAIRDMYVNDIRTTLPPGSGAHVVIITVNLNVLHSRRIVERLGSNNHTLMFVSCVDEYHITEGVEALLDVLLPLYKDGGITYSVPKRMLGQEAHLLQECTVKQQPSDVYFIARDFPFDKRYRPSEGSIVYVPGHFKTTVKMVGPMIHAYINTCI